MRQLYRRLLLFSFFNLILVATIGLLLRSYPFFQAAPFDYKFMLHGHSHFAFGGWVMPALYALILYSFPGITNSVAYHHWRNIGILMLVSAYGMLFSFPVQGYKAVSISFSTLSIVSGFYWAIVTWSAMKGKTLAVSEKFLSWSLVYMCLSSIGPFTTGPLIVMGMQGSDLYFDAIYFFLHFQYNGFFVFLVLSLLYRAAEKEHYLRSAKAFYLFNAACLPAYALSVLWHQPSLLFNITGGIAAVLQLVGCYYLFNDLFPLFKGKDMSACLIKFAGSGFILKLVLQLLSALPVVALMAYRNRNFVIAYLHLVLLGCITTIIFYYAFKQYYSKVLKTALYTFLIAFLVIEIVLVVSAYLGMKNILFPYYDEILLGFTALLLLAAASLYLELRRSFMQSPIPV